MSLTKGGKIVLGMTLPVIVGAIVFPLTWTISNWRKVHEMDPNKKYTVVDLEQAKEDGRNEAFADKLEKEERIKKLQNTITELNTELLTANGQIDLLTRQSADYLATAERLQSENEILTASVNSLTLAKEQGEKRIQELTARITELEKELEQNNESSLKLEIERLQNLVEQQTQTNNAQSILINQLNEQKARIETQYNNLVLETGDTLATINNLQNQINKLQSDVNYYNKILSAYQNENDVVVVYKVKNKVHEIKIGQIGSTLPSVKDVVLNENERFIGWTLDGEILIDKDTFTLTEDITLIAKITESYPVDFVYENENYTQIKVLTGGYAQIENPTDTPYKKFIGWSLDRQNVVNLSDIKITSATTFYAVIEYYYDVKFIVKGVEQEELSQIVKQGECAKTVETENFGFGFIGFTLDGENLIDIESYKVNSNVTFIAKFEYISGLYDSETKELTKTWDDLLKSNFSVNNGILVGRFDSPSNPLRGELIVDKSIVGVGDFNYFKGLTKIYFPETVVDFSNAVFSECSNLTEINLPDSLTRLNENMFWRCSSLKKITLPSCLTEIGKSAFAECVSLESIKIPKGVDKLQQYTFIDCENLQSIEFDSDSALTTIEEQVFERNFKLEELYIPKNVVSIAAHKLQNNVSKNYFKRIVVDSENLVYEDRGLNCLFEKSTNKLLLGCVNSIIPSDIEVIGRNAFYKVDGLETITIPEGVKRIERCAIYSIESLKTINVSSTVNFCDEYCFSANYSLETITFNGINVPELKDSLTYLYKLQTIYVPNEAIEDYKNALPEFVDKIVGF